ncbi:MAG: P-II family nitrogen regulator [Burkholderiales bacterium]|nr:P-II family nitrogen regulator [Burkholderiales bacterium]
MKEVKAYVPHERVADVVAALRDSLVWGGSKGDRRHNLAVYVVKGFALSPQTEDHHFSMALGDEVVNEYKLELICEDAEADGLVAAIVAAARTGQALAGWITVSELVSAVPIK